MKQTTLASAAFLLSLISCANIKNAPQTASDNYQTSNHDYQTVRHTCALIKTNPLLAVPLSESQTIYTGYPIEDIGREYYLQCVFDEGLPIQLTLTAKAKDSTKYDHRIVDNNVDASIDYVVDPEGREIPFSHLSFQVQVVQQENLVYIISSYNSLMTDQLRPKTNTTRTILM